jgi:lipopolysaccharide transport system permease protein
MDDPGTSFQLPHRREPVVRPLHWLAAPFAAFFRHRDLTRELTKREILGRYRGASFGLLWSLFNPLLVLAVYTVAFGGILKSRWPQQGNHDVPFGLIIFVGIIVHGLFAECFSIAPRLMVQNANYVKKVVFPLDLLVWPLVLSALFHTMMSSVVFLLLGALMYGHFSPLAILLPIVLVPLVLLTVAVCWVVASLGVYFRDIGLVTPVVSTALFFLSSAIVPLQSVPPHFRIFFQLNPLTFFIDQARMVTLWGQWPDWAQLGEFLLIGLVACYLANLWFRKVSKGFADVL